MEKSEVKSFYDDFLESTMLEYRVRGNKRIDHAVQRIKQYVRPESRILDVGCGIGLVAEQLTDHLGEGHVWAFDISERNIWYSRKTVNRKNVDFFSADIVDEKKKVKNNVSKEIDVFCLVDVIEHIPIEKHRGVFEFLSELASNRSFIVLTYPSPQFQKYLKKEKPQNIQVIDQVIEIGKVIEVANKYDFSLCHYSLETIWMRNQYVHCVLQNDNSVSSVEKEINSLPKKIYNKCISKLKNKIVYPFKKWWYIERVFEN